MISLFPWVSFSFELKATAVAPIIVNKILIKSLLRNTLFSKIDTRIALVIDVIVPEGTNG